MRAEIARAKSARDGGRHASDSREAEWRPIAPDMPACKPPGRRRSTDFARGGQRRLVRPSQRLAVAHVAEGVSAAAGGVPIFPGLAQWRFAGIDQPSPCAGGAQGGGAVDRPVRRRRRQPVGEDRGKRRPARFRRRQEGRGPQAAPLESERKESDIQPLVEKMQNLLLKWRAE